MGSNLSKQEWRPFDPDAESPYDLKQYLGRIAHFYTILDPRTLLISPQQIQSSKEVLSRFDSNPSIINDPVTNRLLWRSKLNLQSVLHPDTKEAIFWMFRFSAFPITTLLLYPGSPSVTVFSQFVNQTYNVAVNYSNRNASNPMSNSKLFVSYVAAVSASCGIGFGLRRLTKGYDLKHSVFLRGFIPYTALTLASCFNLYFIRWNEVTEGIKLQTRNEELGRWEAAGHSTRAGHIALAKCSAARAIWSIPPLFGPPLIMRTLFLKRTWFIGLRAWQKMAIESGVIGAVLLTFIPPSLAVFPQRDCVSSKWLEPRFKKEYAEDTLFYFNKGL